MTLYRGPSSVGSQWTSGPPGADGADGAPGINGINGAPGINGADGAAATITVGTTSTGAPGTPAAVINSGTASAAVFDFTIPRGDTGSGGGGSGTVNSFAFTNANGFTGVVTAATTAPELKVGTSITGILKGSGVAISAAVGTDLPLMTATTSGAVPTPPNNTTTFLRGDGTFATPPIGGSGTVTSVSVVTANGVSAAVATATTTPALTFTLGNITPSKVNGNTITNGTGVLTLGAGKTLTASNTLTLAGTDGTVMTFPSATANVGYLEVPQTSKSTDYTLALADSGKHIYHPSADTTARTFTIPANSSVAYPIGTALTFINDTGAGVVTIAITSDVMILAGAGTTGSITLTASNMATLIKVAATRWMASKTG